MGEGGRVEGKAKLKEVGVRGRREKLGEGGWGGGGREEGSNARRWA